MADNIVEAVTSRYIDVGLCEKVSIELTGMEVDEIMCYQEKLGVDTVQKAIMNAVRIAMDDESEANEIADYDPIWD